MHDGQFNWKVVYVILDAREDVDLGHGSRRPQSPSRPLPAGGVVLTVFLCKDRVQLAKRRSVVDTDIVTDRSILAWHPSDGSNR